MYSLLWSEHCGYKHSRKLLRPPADRRPRVLQGPGENAGVIDVGRRSGAWRSRWRATTTRPRSSRSRARRPASAASCATSSRWARGRSRSWTRCASASRPPIASGTCSPGWSRGIGHYGNCVGVPTSAARSTSSRLRAQLPGQRDVRRAAAGDARSTSAGAAGAGNLAGAVRRETGRDGIGGASVLASQDFDEGAADKRPSVQIGDPFTGKKPDRVHAASCSTGATAGWRCRTSAPPGLTRPPSEMAARGGVGVESTCRGCRCARRTCSRSR